MSKISSVQWACVLVATVAFVGIYATLQQRPPPELAQTVLVTIGVSAVAAAFVSIGLRSPRSL